jgi:hypothetical protein
MNKVKKTTYRRARANLRYNRRVITKPNGDREITVTPAWIDEFGSSIVLVVKLVGVLLLAIGLAFGALLGLLGRGVAVIRRWAK